MQRELLNVIQCLIQFRCQASYIGILPLRSFTTCLTIKHVAKESLLWSIYSICSQHGSCCRSFTACQDCKSNKAWATAAIVKVEVKYKLCSLQVLGFSSQECSDYNLLNFGSCSVAGSYQMSEEHTVSMFRSEGLGPRKHWRLWQHIPPNIST